MHSFSFVFSLSLNLERVGKTNELFGRIDETPAFF